ncbi:MAG: pyruvate kinase, partial [Elusimicrobia bacterium]|nr:pyruvate kinase [Elusimicrobiota bacterium]
MTTIVRTHPKADASDREAKTPADSPMPLKRTKVLATLGPASMNPEVLKSLIEAGTNAVRLNCSHASQGELTRAVRLVRRCSSQLRIPVSIMLDLQGPRLRTGRLRNGEPVMLKAGSPITITTEDVPGTESLISTNYRDLPKKVAKGSRILLDEGNLELQVVRPNSHEVACEVVVGGILKEHKGINLPRIDINLPAVTAKDRQDLEWGLTLGVDYVALSFVRDADDVRQVRKLVRSRNKHTLVVAKIERPEAIVKIHAILE